MTFSQKLKAKLDDAAILMFDSGDGFNEVMIGTWVPPHMQLRTVDKQPFRCLLRLPACCYVPFSEERLLSDHSIMKGWLVGNRTGCLSVSVFHLHKDSVALIHNYRWLVGYLSDQDPFSFSFAKSMMSVDGYKIPLFQNDRGHCAFKHCCRDFPLSFQVYRQLSQVIGLIFTLTPTISCKTFLRQVFAFQEPLIEVGSIRPQLQMSSRGARKLFAFLHF